MKKLVRPFTTCFALLCLLPGPVNAAGYGTGWYGEIQTSIAHEDNIARTYLNDEETDVISSLSLGGGYATGVGTTGQIVFSGYFVSNHYRDTDALNNLGVALGVDYTFQPRVSYSAPWYNISVQVIDRNFKDSEPREGLLVLTELASHKRLTTTLTGHLGLRHNEVVFNGKSSAQEDNDAAFDVSSYEVFVGLDHVFRNGLAMFGEYSYRSGDIVTTVSGGLRNDREYEAETVDEVFSPGCNAVCSYAYRQDGKTNLFKIGIAYPFRSFNLDLSANYFDAEGDNGRSYEDLLLRLGLVWVF